LDFTDFTRRIDEAAYRTFGVGFSWRRVPVFETVNEAGLLVMLPALFLTTTVNCAPLSEAMVAAVV
jgi:hypothetical protein